MTALKEFYAVTATSVYHVEYDEKNIQARATKIALRGKSKIKLGKVLSGPMLAIAKWLQFYIPEGGGLTSYERKVERVSTRYWLGNTSFVIALFFNEVEAKDCLLVYDNLLPCDPRWLDSTKKIIEAIGQEHPVFEVCEYEDMKLCRGG
ncbi:MAG: hypothetical protein HYX21_01055 [Candidatus Yanofskybacteria bacterium]|nr:hypothetical protein [Candidatus Yanofskybacteria bacterium]